MTSIHDLKLGSNTLEVLEVILNALEKFPEDIARLDLSSFTAIASNIDNLVKNATEVQNNISDMKTAIQNSKTEFDTNKVDFDTKYRQFGQDLVTAEAIKQTILDTQNAINMIKNGVDEAKTQLDTFSTKYDTFVREYNTIMALSANIDSIENLLNDLRNILDNGVIDDNNASTQKTYSSKKISDDTKALKTELNLTLNQGLETKLSKAEYEADKPTFALKTELNNRVDELSQSLNDGLNTKLNVSSLVSELGSSESLVVSQKTVSDALALKAGLTDLKPANTLLATMDTPIGITTLGTQFYCLANQNQYILTDNEEVTTETTLQSLIDNGKVINITPLGVGQTWQDVTSQREANKNYVNTTDRPIAVIIYIRAGYGTTSTVYLDDKPVAGIVGETARGFGGNAFLIVQPLSKYKSDGSASAWYELR